MRGLLIEHLAAGRQSTRHSLEAKALFPADPVYPTIADVDWQRCTAEADGRIEGVHLWFEGDELIGFVWPEDNQAVHLVVHPGHAEVEPLLLRWAEDWRRQCGGPSALTELGVWVFENDARRIGLLGESGYSRSELARVLYHRSLAEPVPPPFLRYGYTIVAVAVASPAERASFYNTAFPGARRTAAQCSALLRSPAYRADLDLWAIAPRGEPAAYALACLDPVNQLGILQPVACHPAHRHHGLGTALLHECMGRLKASGAVDVQVQAWSEETTTIRLYQGTGFRIAGRNVLWLKTMTGQR
ncbi:MAG: GNAT family N-acetyltransferase [Mycobacterium leprae]